MCREIREESEIQNVPEENKFAIGIHDASYPSLTQVPAPRRLEKREENQCCSRSMEAQMQCM